MRLILVTGKGGTGKTTLAAATALRAAERGQRTVLLSTDAAHSLSDVWDRRPSAKPVRLMPNLWVHEVNVGREIEASWGTIARFITRFLRSQGVDDLLADELAVLPGVEELVFLLSMERHLTRGEADLLVVDCAPTASTVRLLAFPDAFHRSMAELFPRGRRLAHVLRPAAEAYLRAPLPGDEVFDTWRALSERLAVLRKAMVDPRITSVRVVVNPQRTVLRESQRIVAVLHLFGLCVDAVVVNRLGRAGDASDARSPAEIECLDLARESFAPIPILTCATQSLEVVGARLIGDLACEVYGNRDAAGLLHRDRPMTIARENGRRVLSIHLPIAEGRELDLHRTGDELLVEVGSFRRALALPRALRHAHIAGATLEGSRLRVRFEDGSSDEEKET